MPEQYMSIQDAAQQKADELSILGKDIGEIVAKKNLEYGDSFAQSGEILKILYADGVKKEQYGDVLFIARILDKLFRVASSTPEDRAEWGESPGFDIAGYGILLEHSDRRVREVVRGLLERDIH